MAGCCVGGKNLLQPKDNILVWEEPWWPHAQSEHSQVHILGQSKTSGGRYMILVGLGDFLLKHTKHSSVLSNSRIRASATAFNIRSVAQKSVPCNHIQGRSY